MSAAPTGFDPAAATEAYLSRLSPALRRAAEIHTETAHWLWGGDVVVMLAACWLMARFDLLGAVARRAGRGGERPWPAALACAAVLAAVLMILTTLVGMVGASLSGQPAPPVPYGLWLVAAVVVLPVLYAAARATPHRWWLWSGGAFAGLALLVLWLPFASASGSTDLPSAPPGPIREALLSLARDAGLAIDDIHVSPSAAVDADVTGMQGRPRIVISKGLLTQETPAQARAAVGHLMGHYANQDQLTLALVFGVLALAVLYAVHRLFAAASRAMGRGGWSLADPAGLPAAMAVGITAVTLATVGYDNVVRLVNVRADHYALDHAREPDGLAQELLAAPLVDKVDPSGLEETLFYNHPALKTRILQAMRWKAAQTNR